MVLFITGMLVLILGYIHHRHAQHLLNSVGDIRRPCTWTASSAEFAAASHLIAEKASLSDRSPVRSIERSIDCCS